jgi:alpha-tubulin suppressor-like RCC1 family protein
VRPQWLGLNSVLVPLLVLILLALTIGHSLGASTTTSASFSPNPNMYGEPVTITATVEGSGLVAPTGMVRFAGDDATPGTATITPSSAPDAIGAYRAVATGWEHTCALTSAGGVKCWGMNDKGQLGDGTKTDTLTPRLTPVDVSGLSSGVSAIATGGRHTCALTSAGGVKCWGSNESGQLGDWTTTNKLSPGYVAGLGTGVSAIATGAGHTCALTSAGGVKCWGSNYFGQLGGENNTRCRLHLAPEGFCCSVIPVDVSGLSSGVSAIAAGVTHVRAV